MSNTFELFTSRWTRRQACNEASALATPKATSTRCWQLKGCAAASVCSLLERSRDSSAPPGQSGYTKHRSLSSTAWGAADGRCNQSACQRSCRLTHPRPAQGRRRLGGTHNAEDGQQVRVLHQRADCKFGEERRVALCGDTKRAAGERTLWASQDGCTVAPHAARSQSGATAAAGAVSYLCVMRVVA